MKLLLNLDSWRSDPRGMLILFLLAFPGRILALSVHEYAHAWVANRCGDPTAKLMGRLTINPLKHLDLWGTVLMLVVGFGYARPVPVNPRNYRNYRRDDLKVSVAGVTMNLIMFLLANLLMFAFFAAALAKTRGEGWNGYVGALLSSYGYYDVALAQISYAFGTIPEYLYEMLYYFAATNLVLCLFNLLPVPPLDGYHVFNDLVLRRRKLFADPRTARYASMALMVLAFSGILGRGLGWAQSNVFALMGRLGAMALRALNLIA